MNAPAPLTEGLLGRVTQAADAIDAERRLPDALVAELKRAGLFRALIPESLGGLEMPLGGFLPVVQALAQADASTAWCVNQAAVIAMTTAWLAPADAGRIWDDADAALANGPPLDCAASPVPGGYRLSGRWGFSSGCQHATWMIGAAPVTDSRRWIMAVFPKTQATFHDTWQVQGLRGTGSFEFSVHDLMIERALAVDMSQPSAHGAPLYRIPVGLVFAVSFAAVALGVARAGLDTVFALADDKVPGYSRQVLKDDALVQDQLGEAEVRWRAAQAYLYATVDKVWNAMPEAAFISDEQRIDLRMAGTHVIREAAAALDIGYQVAGSSGIYHDNPLHRRFQDMKVITQHVQGRRSHYGFVGKYLLGFPFQPGPLN